MCGEKHTNYSDGSGQQGSPPRMRGKERLLHREQRVTRITPAYAGKRPPPVAAALAIGDHPRVCGEKEAAALSEVYETGSPPRMRGKGTYVGTSLNSNGITPAYAGKSQLQNVGHTQAGDHPRVCGEKCALAL